MLLINGFYGCSITKATQQVLSNSGAFNKVGSAWAKLNPCVVDSTKTLVHDTTIAADTVYKLLTAPASKNGSGPAINGNINLPQTGRPVHDTLIQTVTRTVSLHDSVKIVSVDKRQLGICNDSITFYKILYANYKTDAVKQVDGWKNKAQARLWYLIALIILTGVYIFRKPLLSVIGVLPAFLTKKL